MVRKLSDAMGLNLAEIIPDLSDEEWAARDLRVAEMEIERAVAEEKERWEETKELLLGRGLADRHLQVLFGGKTLTTPSMDAVAKMGTEGISILSGNVGCGKTYAAHAWLLDATTRSPLEWRSNGIRMATSAWFARTSRYGADGEKFDLLSASRKLVLDDLGVEYGDKTGSYLVDLDELFDLRWRSKSPTLITTNLPSEEFKKRYGNRLYDRARDGGGWFNVKHTSMRNGNP